MQVTSTRFFPLLVSPRDELLSADQLVDEFTSGLGVAYSFGPPYGEHLVTWTDLDRLGLSRRAVRRIALDNLERAAPRLDVHGEPPALLLSFDGLACSALLLDEFWADFPHPVPGELVVAAPARDVVLVTSSLSRPGLERVRRAVDRVFFAGDRHPLTGDLLVWRQGAWQPFTPATPPPVSSVPWTGAPEAPWPREASAPDPRVTRWPETRRPSGPVR